MPQSLGEKTKLRCGTEGMGFDKSRSLFYFSDIINGEFSVFNESLEEIGVFRFTESKSLVDKYLAGSGLYTKFAIHLHYN